MQNHFGKILRYICSLDKHFGLCNAVRMTQRTFNMGAQTFVSGLEAESIDFCYIDPPFMTQKAQRGSRGAYNDTWTSLKHYLAYMNTCFIGMERALTANGSIMVHVDERVVHNLAIILGKVFPVHINDIIWCYQSGGAGKRNLAKKHDTILWYAKSKDYTFNVIREPYPRDYGDRAGFHPDGRMLNDWWQIPIMSTTSSERVGYPNQKPIALLERCISIATNERDVVCDFFCGSGTTGVAAKNLRRKYLLNDSNPDAIAITRERIRNRA